LGVELTDGVESAWKDLAEEVDGADLFALGDVGAVNALGLVEDYIIAFSGDTVAEADAFAVNFDFVGFGIDQDGELVEGAAVNADAAFEDHLFDVAARVNPGVGEEFLDSFFHGDILTRSGAGWV